MVCNYFSVCFFELRCKSTALHAYVQIYMLQNMPLTLHCNICDIFCNIFGSIFSVLGFRFSVLGYRTTNDEKLTCTGQLAEVVLVALGEITGRGETQLHGYLLYRHIGCTE